MTIITFCFQVAPKSYCSFRFCNLPVYLDIAGELSMAFGKSKVYTSSRNGRKCSENQWNNTFS